MMKRKNLRFTSAALALLVTMLAAPLHALADDSGMDAAAGYLVFRARFHDDEARAAYGRAVAVLASEFGGRFLVVSDSPELMEGNDDGRRLVILRFPSVADARAFWTSERYAEVKKLREGAGSVDAVLVRGVPGVQ